MEQLPLLQPLQDQRHWPEGEIAICVSGAGCSDDPSALMVNRMPDLGLVGGTQVFPRRRWGARLREWIDNVQPCAVAAWRAHYHDDEITPDDLFYYIYGILHAPDYRKRFYHDLTKALPRVPFARDFHAFAENGRALAALHVGYETCAEYPLQVIPARPGLRLQDKHFRLGRRAMKFANEERSVLAINEHVRVVGIPAAAHRYRVHGRTPIEWWIDQYRIRQDKQSGIVNDPNEWRAWRDQPREFVTHLARVVHVSVETTRIVEGLPPALEES